MSSAARTPVSTLQSRKQQLVRNEIWSAAVELFHASGFDNVTIDQIAAHAGVSRRTFFRYFASKDDVLASTMRNFGHNLAASINEDRTGTAYEAAKRAVLAILGPAAQTPTTQRVVEIAKRSAGASGAQMQQRWIVEQQVALAFATRARRRSPRLEDRILAALTLSATSLAVELWVEQPKRVMSEIVEEVFAKTAQLTR